MDISSTTTPRTPDTDPADSPTPPAATAGPGTSLRPGSGRITVAHVAGRSQVIRNLATNPLKLWVPRRPGPASWITATTFGGGLVAGDRIQIDLELEPHTTTVLTTQASTKVYRSLDDRGCSQQLQARVGQDALLVVAPDPLVCFRDAIYEQHNRIHLADDASLVHIDWLTSGRIARGECWQFHRLVNRLEVIRDDTMILLDSLELVPREVALENPLRMGHYHCLANVVIFGKRLAHEIDSIREQIAAQLDNNQHDTQDGCLEAVSPRDDGLVWRLVGPNSETVGKRLRQRLAFLADHLHETPWERKW